MRPEELKSAAEDRRRLTGAYKLAMLEISAILFRHDPVGINFGGNTDEYDLEAGTILPRLRIDMTTEAATAIVHEEFVRWFTLGEAGAKSRYANIAAEILAAYRQRGLP